MILPFGSPEFDWSGLSNLVAFYRENAPDSEGRTLSQLWAWDDERLEEVHDYIQWLFPLPEPSQFNPDAPLLTPQDIEAFKWDSDGPE